MRSGIELLHEIGRAAFFFLTFFFATINLSKAEIPMQLDQVVQLMSRDEKIEAYNILNGNSNYTYRLKQVSENKFIKIYNYKDISSNETITNYYFAFLFTEGQLTEASHVMEYSGQNFTFRNKEFHSKNFFNVDSAVAALEDFIAIRKFTFYELSSYLIKNGFFLHKENNYSNNIYGIYVKNPYEIGSIQDLLGGNFNPNGPLAICISATDKKSVEVTVNVSNGRSKNECKLYFTLLAEQQNRILQR